MLPAFERWAHSLMMSRKPGHVGLSIGGPLTQPSTSATHAQRFGALVLLVLGVQGMLSMVLEDPLSMPTMCPASVLRVPGVLSMLCMHPSWRTCCRCLVCLEGVYLEGVYMYTVAAAQPWLRAPLVCHSDMPVRLWQQIKQTPLAATCVLSYCCMP